MDKIDGEILNILQNGMPIAEYPFHDIGKNIGLEAEEVVERLQRLKAEGYVRRLGAVFDTRKMNYKSMLYAMEVPEDIFYKTAEIINGYNGVTHNYRRNNRLNLWFTLSARNEQEMKDIISNILEKSGVETIYEFPAEKFFKLKVFFDMGGDKK